MFYNRSAQIAGEYLKNYSLVYFEGRLRTLRVMHKYGVDNYVAEFPSATGTR